MRYTSGGDPRGFGPRVLSVNEFGMECLVGETLRVLCAAL